MALPPCGLYKTKVALGDAVPAGRLVYFHNHGDPGAGVYLPSGWSMNRVRWHERGNVLPDEAWASTLIPLAAEGLYRVRESFTCCERNCRTFAPELLVQLGYDGEGNAILFVPEWTERGLAIPERGSRIEQDRAAKLVRLSVAEGQAAPAAAPGGMMH